jgi:PAS domain S-box-containing protein
MMGSRDSADGRQADTLKTVLALHAIAIDGMAEGLCVLDSELRVVLFNRRLLQVLDLPPDSVKIGASLKSILAHVNDQATAASTCRAEMWRELDDIFTLRKSFNLDRRTASGTFVRIHFQPTSGDGWVATCAPAHRQAVEREQNHELDRLRQLFAHSSRGVCMYDADERLILHNERYLQLLGFADDHVRPGMSYRDILALAIDLGLHPDMAPEKLGAIQAALFRSEPTTQQVGLSDGRTIQMTVRPAGHDGWVVECEDVTAHVLYERALPERNQLLDSTSEHLAHG